MPVFRACLQSVAPARRGASCNRLQAPQLTAVFGAVYRQSRVCTMDGSRLLDGPRCLLANPHDWLPPTWTAARFRSPARGAPKARESLRKTARYALAGPPNEIRRAGIGLIGSCAPSWPALCPSDRQVIDVTRGTYPATSEASCTAPLLRGPREAGRGTACVLLSQMHEPAASWLRSSCRAVLGLRVHRLGMDALRNELRRRQG